MPISWNLVIGASERIRYGGLNGLNTQNSQRYMAKRFIDTNIFRKPSVRAMKAPYKALFIYLLCECDHAGVWDVELDVAEARLGMKLDPDKALAELGGTVVEVGTGKWWVADFVEFQYGNLNPSNRVHLSVLNRLSSLGIDPENKPLASPLEGAKDKEKDKDTELEEKERARESKQRAEESFARFWAVYARKEGKQAAVKAWTRLTDEDRAEAEKRAKSFCAARDPAYLPHPATYLNGRRWEDADPPKPAPKAVNGQPAMMSRAEAMEALRKIRAQHGIPVGGFIEAHLIPDEVNKALR